jgi:hypothetical protein
MPSVTAAYDALTYLKHGVNELSSSSSPFARVPPQATPVHLHPRTMLVRLGLQVPLPPPAFSARQRRRRRRNDNDGSDKNGGDKGGSGECDGDGDGSYDTEVLCACALTAKAAGNALFRVANYSGAIAAYTRALQVGSITCQSLLALPVLSNNSFLFHHSRRALTCTTARCRRVRCL